MDDIEIERLLASGTHAELVVGHLQHFVDKGGDGDSLKIEAITLASPPDAWPATIRLEYTIKGERHIDESEWAGIYDEPSPDWSVISTRGEAEVFMGIILAHWDEQGLI